MLVGGFVGGFADVFDPSALSDSLDFPDLADAEVDSDAEVELDDELESEDEPEPQPTTAIAQTRHIAMIKLLTA